MNLITKALFAAANARVIIPLEPEKAASVAKSTLGAFKDRGVVRASTYEMWRGGPFGVRLVVKDSTDDATLKQLRKFVGNQTRHHEPDILRESQLQPQGLADELQSRLGSRLEGAEVSGEALTLHARQASDVDDLRREASTFVQSLNPAVQVSIVPPAPPPPRMGAVSFDASTYNPDD